MPPKSTGGHRYALLRTCKQNGCQHLENTLVVLRLNGFDGFVLPH